MLGMVWEMKAWQNLMGIVLDTVVDGDKIFQGVSERRGINYILTLARNEIRKKRKETNWRMIKTKMI